MAARSGGPPEAASAANEGGTTGSFPPSSFIGRGRLCVMRQTYTGLREGALTLAYNAIVWARGLARQATRPTEMGVRALVLRGDVLLLVRHRGGSKPWALPGGGISPKEPLDVAARREVQEEAGCAVELEHMLGLYHSFGQGMNNYIAVFVGRPLGPARPP